MTMTDLKTAVDALTNLSARYFHRLPAVLMTAISFVLGVLPLVLASGAFAAVQTFREWAKGQGRSASENEA
jgi:multidrug efflux pump subunit AcrB